MNHNHSLITILLLLTQNPLFPQIHDHNHILTKTYTNESGTTLIQTIQYFNDLG